MGNPTPQPRTNAPKTNLKPKHRHSGSVSNISFTSEDLKPKHRHSGSVSNISFTPEDLKPKHRHSGSVSNISITSEDLKPKHRHSGSVSNISFTPEDVKPKHRHSGSVSNISFTPEDVKLKHRHSGSASNISITPDDVKPKHRYSGSVSSITINSEDFSSPSRGDVSSPSSISSVSSSSVSLKEKRLKRRTRSSLGGTEDFIKELDFLTPPSNGRSSDSSTRKELLKPSPSPPFSDSAALQASSEALAPVPEASVPSLVEGFGENLPVEHANGSMVDKGGVGENGGSKSEKSVSLGEEILPHGDAVQLAELKCNGGDRESTVTVETSSEGHHPVRKEAGEHESQTEISPALENGSALRNGHLPVTVAAAIPIVGTVTRESDSTEPSDAQKEVKEVPKSVPGVRPPPESLVSNTTGASIPHNTSEQQRFTISINSVPSINGGMVLSLANGDSLAEPSKQELSQDKQRSKDIQDEKVSVQKRIEELEKIAGARPVNFAGGRPVHFRSQSLSLPRPFDISHAKHHEAEGSKGFKMPVYKAPLDGFSVSEMGIPELVETSTDEKLLQESLHSEGKASAGDTSSIAPVAHEISAPETEHQNVLQNGGGRSETQTVRSPSNESSDQPEPHVETVLSKGPEAIEVPADSMVNGIHLENGMAAKSLERVPANQIEIIAGSETLDDVKAPANGTESITELETTDDVKAHAPEKQKVVEMGKEGGVESGLGEPYVIVSADSVPQELPLVPAEPHSEAPPDQTRENGGKVETAETGGLMEQSPGAPKTGTAPEAHQIGTLSDATKAGMLPVAYQRGTIPDAPSTQASTAESMLLTKQPTVDPLFIDSPQDWLWEMHSQELTVGESSGNEVRESSGQDDDLRHFSNGSRSHAEVTPAGNTTNGDAQSEKSGKHDRPRTPLRSLLAEEDAEKCPDSVSLGTPPQNQSVSPRGNLFKRIVSGGKNSPTKQTTPTKFSPRNQSSARPFLSSCMCCSVK